jgi:hypothetical protein
VRGRKASNKPTIVNPESYRFRFIESMVKYFILVPDFGYRPDRDGSVSIRKALTRSSTKEEEDEEEENGEES